VTASLPGVVAVRTATRRRADGPAACRAGTAAAAAAAAVAGSGGGCEAASWADCCCCSCSRWSPPAATEARARDDDDDGDGVTGAAGDLQTARASRIKSVHTVHVTVGIKSIVAAARF